jgi:carbonic anhydrase/acetyltransferase-like protein (isoleucine patch superfamily)
MKLPIGNVTPRIGKNVFLAPDAWLIADVELADDVSVFFGAVLRGDIKAIRVGARTNIQEHALLHTTGGRTPTIIGEDCTIGHRAIVHGATVSDRCLLGMGAIILDEAVIEEECIIGAGALVPEGKRIPSRSLVVGVPGKIVRTISDEEVADLKKAAAAYVRTGATLEAAIKNQSTKSS